MFFKFFIATVFLLIANLSQAQNEISGYEFLDSRIEFESNMQDRIQFYDNLSDNNELNEFTFDSDDLTVTGYFVADGDGSGHITNIRYQITYYLTNLPLDLRSCPTATFTIRRIRGSTHYERINGSCAKESSHESRKLNCSQWTCQSKGGPGYYPYETPMVEGICKGGPGYYEYACCVCP